MKKQPKLLAVLTAAVLSAGCASGGDSGAGGETSFAPQPANTPCGTTDCVPFRPKSAGFPVVGPYFSTWADLRADTPTNSKWALGALVSFDDAFRSVGAWHPSTLLENVWVQYDAQGNLFQFNYGRGSSQSNLAAVDQSGIDVAHSPINELQPQSPFSSLPVGLLGVIANPYAQGWNYQSFGVWGEPSAAFKTVSIRPLSMGTANWSAPTSGTATFTGKLGGLYVSPTGQGSIAAADLRVDANFSTRSLTFASSSTVTTRDLVTATAAPNLNLSGTLTYTQTEGAPGRFSGALTNAGGTMSGSTTGRYYGPNAQELGGVFAVKSPTTIETFVGAYGAKR